MGFKGSHDNIRLNQQLKHNLKNKMSLQKKCKFCPVSNSLSPANEFYYQYHLQSCIINISAIFVDIWFFRIWYLIELYIITMESSRYTQPLVGLMVVEWITGGRSYINLIRVTRICILHEIMALSQEVLVPKCNLIW